MSLHSLIISGFTLLIMHNIYAQQKPYVDYGYFKQLVKEVKPYRAERLVKFNAFLEMAKDANTIILDTRSKAMYDELHLKGAVHLSFSDFTQENLEKVIPSKDTRVLIYCNNNFAQDNPVYVGAFSMKAIGANYKYKFMMSPKEESFALTIPAFINLYGYGYKKIFELDELIYNDNPRVFFEGNRSEEKYITSKKSIKVYPKDSFFDDVWGNKISVNSLSGIKAFYAREEFKSYISDSTFHDSISKLNNHRTQPYMNYGFLEELVDESESHRGKRLIEFKEFSAKSKEVNTIILDTRSREMYYKLHIKGAINLPFADFKEESLSKLLRRKDANILIYCNNNFVQNKPIINRVFATKAVVTPSKVSLPDPVIKTLALNIPTYLNLFGYGYKNVYELNELISYNDSRLQLEGTDLDKLNK